MVRDTSRALLWFWDEKLSQKAEGRTIPVVGGIGWRRQRETTSLKVLKDISRTAIMEGFCRSIHYGTETWRVREKTRLVPAQMWIWRRMIKTSWIEVKTNASKTQRQQVKKGKKTIKVM